MLLQQAIALVHDPRSMGAREQSLIAELGGAPGVDSTVRQAVPSGRYVEMPGVSHVSIDPDSLQLQMTALIESIERDVGRLWGSFNEGLPGQHSIEEQGLFFVGYYQERFGGRPDESVGTEPGIDTTETPDDQE